MLSRVSSCLALLTVFLNAAAGATLQDKKLPSPAAFETVFPHVVFGDLGGARYQTSLFLANSENRAAQIELDFRYADGQSAAALVYPGGDLYPVTGPAAKNGLFYFEVPRHGVLELALPGKDAQLLNMAFDGWAIVRSNTRIFAYQTSKVVDTRNISSEARYATAHTATKRAEIEVTNIKWEPVGEGSAQWWGWNYRQSGVALVNPFPTATSLLLKLKDRTAQLEMPPHTKRTFLISEMFPGYKGAFSYDMDHTLSLEARNETGFVSLGLDTFIDTDPNGLPDPGADRPWISFSLPRLNIPGGVLFSFPDPILAESSLGGWGIFLSNLGLVIAGSDNQLPGVFPVNLQHNFLEALGITTDETQGVAVIYGASEIPIVFEGTGHVLTIPEAGYGGPPETTSPVRQLHRGSSRVQTPAAGGRGDGPGPRYQPRGLARPAGGGVRPRSWH